MVSLDLPQYPPEGEPAILLYLERCLFAGFAVVMLSFGVFITLTLACLYAMLFHPLNGKRHWPLIGFIALLSLGSTVFVVTNYIWSQLMWIDARAYPGGPPAFFTEQFGVWINTVSNSALAFNNFLLDALLLWRCYTVWNRRLWIVLVPICAWIATGVLAVLSIYESAKPGATDPFLAVKFARPYFCACLGLNVILTTLIVSRLLYMRKQMRGLGKQHSRVFTSMVALIVDSALPYTLVSVFFIFTITYEKNMHIQYSSAFAVPLVGGVLWIVSMCILLRAALGRGFQTQSQAPQRSGLDFWSPSRPVSTMFIPMQAAAMNDTKRFSDYKQINDDIELGKPTFQPSAMSATRSETSSVTLPVSPRQTYHLPRRIERRPEFARSQQDMQQDYELRLAYDTDERDSIPPAPTRQFH
jgi:hypothetical protein